ncbi:ABC transporter ATP-binding protein [Priestia aryabhattai]|uniref:ABC transporter ATP-binding protein n=1 Tax=Priestia aryabhattai TaxID=412384 RepID=UPI003B673162
MFNSSNISLKEILNSFMFWPKIFKLLWNIDKKPMLFIIILTILEGLIPPSLLLVNKQLINNVQVGISQGVSIIILSGSCLFSLYLLQIIIGQANGYLDQVFQKKLGYSISAMLMEKSSKLSLENFENDKIYDQLQRVMGDANHRPYMVFNQLLSIISNIITLLATSLILITWKWWLVFSLIVIPILSSISFFKLSKLEFNIEWERTPIRRKLWYYSLLLTRDFSVKEIKLFNLSEYILNRYKEINKNFFLIDKKLVKKKIRVSFFFEIINQIFLLILMSYIIFSAFVKQILIGSMVAYIQALTSTQKCFQSLIQQLFSIYENNLYMTLLFDFLDIEEEIQSLNVSEVHLEKIETIEFKNVSFKYPNTDSYVLKNVNFLIKNNDIVAIVGKNGSGKSTAIKILARLYTNYEGSVLINNVPVERFSKQSLVKQIGIVFQDFVKYELTARENIGYGDINKLSNDTSILKVANDTNTHELLKKMPLLLDTQLGKIFSEGYQLSGGEWQKIAITRTIFKDSSVYILDEPSAALDPYAEKEIFSKFHELIQNKIGIYISHRFTTVKQATKILVFDKGSIVEEGTHDYLMSLEGRYYQIYHLQASAYKSNERKENINLIEAT